MRWIEIFAEKLWKYMPSEWIEFRKSRLKKYISGTNAELNQIIKEQFFKSIKVGLCILFICFISILGMIFSSFNGQKNIELQRNGAGEGESQEKVQIKVDGEFYDYELPISEKLYTKEEREKAFEKAFIYLEKQMLGKNKNLSQVHTDLVFLWEIPDSPLEVKWEFEDQSLIDLEGKVNNKTLQNGSKMTHVRLILTYFNDTKEKVYTITICPRRLTKTQEKTELIFEKIKQLESNSRTKDTFQIPLKILDGEIKISKQRNPWMLLLIVVLFLIPLLLLRQFEEEKQKQKEVRQMSELEYSNILWQFILLLEAGFTIKSAWNKIISDYDKKKENMINAKRFVYEQMAYAYRQMELGCSQEKAFEVFSNQMNMKSYSKLMTLFLQNITMGSKRMLEILKTEEQHAFLSRCEQAKRMGEEADTKLLLPMGIMLLNILLLLMVPAYLQF